MKKRLLGGIVVAVLLAAGAASLFLPADTYNVISGFWSQWMIKHTVESRVAQYGEAVRSRFAEDFARAGVAWPPESVTLLVLKEEKQVELWAAGADGADKYLRGYAITAASGVAGPKLREGDRQVPEGFYGVESLNPNSKFHLSLRVNYPNDFDRARAAEEGRDRLGGDIMIHGGRSSVGCVAVGDEASEDLFILAALAGIENVKILIAPCDLRVKPIPEPGPGAPAWLAGLYRDLQAKIGAMSGG